MTEASTLNRPEEFYVFEKHKEFHGSNTTKMAELRAEERTPMSVADILQRRLDVMEDSGDVRDYWIDNYFDTGDAVLRNTNGDVKIVRGSPLLWGINSDTTLRKCAVPLTDEQWEEPTGDNVLVVPAKRAKELDGKLYSQKSVKDVEEWNFLAGGDHDRLVAYADAFFPEMKKRFGNDEAMGIYLPSAQKTPTMRAWFVNRLSGRSDADGWYNLDNDYGRLVGVIAPEAQDALGKGVPVDPSLLRAKAYMDSGESFEHNGTLYVPVEDKRVTLEK